VRRGEEQLPEEEIACRHPDGSGWAGLFEFYYPTEVIELGSPEGSSALAIPSEQQDCLKQAGPFLGGRSALRPDDITVRINLASMDLKQRAELAKDLCMHPAQLLKLMDPDPREDPYQKSPEGNGTAGDKMLKAIPIWATYCKEAATLLSDDTENSKLSNFDAQFYRDEGGKNEQATDLALAYERSSDGKRRERGVSFLIAAGLYAPQMADSDKRTTLYKRFEPLEYFSFRGKQFTGGLGSNEQGLQCRDISGSNYGSGAARSDRWYSNEKSRYAAAMRSFASCPKGWVRWRGSHSENACGEEKLW
jgi:hypothetical protein